jgi:hypothetical protein
MSEEVTQEDTEDESEEETKPPPNKGYAVGSLERTPQ